MHNVVQRLHVSLVFATPYILARVTCTFSNWSAMYAALHPHPPYGQAGCEKDVVPHFAIGGMGQRDGTVIGPCIGVLSQSELLAKSLVDMPTGANVIANVICLGTTVEKKSAHYTTDKSEDYFFNDDGTEGLLRASEHAGSIPLVFLDDSQISLLLFRLDPEDKTLEAVGAVTGSPDTGLLRTRVRD